MSYILVIRTDTGHLRVGTQWFLVMDVAQAARNKLVEAGSRNPAFDAPPFCYTFCPYGEAILALGCTPVDPPETFRVEHVFHDGRKPAMARDPIWPEVFGIDPALYWFA